MSIKLAVIDKAGKTLCESSAEVRATMVYPNNYRKGDVVVMNCDTPGFYEVRFEDTMPPTIVYVDGGQVKFAIPFGMMERIGYSPRAFKSKMHLITATIANPDFVVARRNLALNPYDGHGSTGMYPHASANVETRDEALFAARNAIDGILANHAHYPYPYQSWGINKNPDAELKLEFGVPVDLDSVVLVLRADYPHDNHWVKAALEFSDGSREELNLIKSDLPQSFAMEKRGIVWLVLKELIPSGAPSPFPALTEIEAWGKVSAGQ